mmetsp:Transcript_7671/g.8374  ORF Transcript_7671/g.8374 Transcript_7671/m.8374 type:complete len:132 (-) Transcript_7671:477-872(-)
MAGIMSGTSSSGALSSALCCSAPRSSGRYGVRHSTTATIITLTIVRTTANPTTTTVRKTSLHLFPRNEVVEAMAVSVANDVVVTVVIAAALTTSEVVDVTQCVSSRADVVQSLSEEIAHCCDGRYHYIDQS